jgi:hypothetical protein
VKKEMAKPGNLVYGLCRKAKEQKLIDGVCRACSNKTGTLASPEVQGLQLPEDMSGYPSMARYMGGYEVITF